MHQRKINSTTPGHKLLSIYLLQILTNFLNLFTDRLIASHSINILALSFPGPHTILVQQHAFRFVHHPEHS